MPQNWHAIPADDQSLLAKTCDPAERLEIYADRRSGDHGPDSFELYRKRWPDGPQFQDKKFVGAAGAGAGLAVAFNAPLGGSIFVFEELTGNITPWLLEHFHSSCNVCMECLNHA